MTPRHALDASIRGEHPEDAAQIAEINRLAFGREDEARLVERLRAAPQFDSQLSRVAVISGQIVGHILFSPCAVNNDDCATPAVCLAPMAVYPDHQRRGIGSALVRDGLRACRDLGHRIVTVVGHAAYYPRFGFEPAARFGIRSPFPVPDEAFMVLALVPGALDGAGGVVRYPAAFADLTDG
jgi:putative acetyltransferase